MTFLLKLKKKESEWEKEVRNEALSHACSMYRSLAISTYYNSYHFMQECPRATSNKSNKNVHHSISPVSHSFSLQKVLLLKHLSNPYRHLYPNIKDIQITQNGISL